MKCLNCGKNIPNDSEFCPYCGNTIENMISCKKCGKAIPEDSEFCPLCGEKVDFTFPCKNCGKKIPSDSEFCPCCGSRQSKSTKPEVPAPIKQIKSLHNKKTKKQEFLFVPPKEKKKIKKSTIIIIAASVAAVIVAIIVTILIGSNSNSSNDYTTTTRNYQRIQPTKEYVENQSNAISFEEYMEEHPVTGKASERFLQKKELAHNYANNITTPVETEYEIETTNVSE